MEFLVTGPIVNIISDEEAKICNQLPTGIYKLDIAPMRGFF